MMIISSPPPFPPLGGRWSRLTCIAHSLSQFSKPRIKNVSGIQATMYHECLEIKAFKSQPIAKDLRLLPHLLSFHGTSYSSGKRYIHPFILRSPPSTFHPSSTPPLIAPSIIIYHMRGCGQPNIGYLDAWTAYQRH